eukprot:gene22989-biopygen19293
MCSSVFFRDIRHRSQVLHAVPYCSVLFHPPCSMLLCFRSALFLLSRGGGGKHVRCVARVRLLFSFNPLHTLAVFLAVQRVPGISGHFRTFPGISGLFRAFPGISGHFRNVPGISGHFGHFPAAPGCSVHFQVVPGCSMLFRAVPRWPVFARQLTVLLADLNPGIICAPSPSPTKCYGHSGKAAWRANRRFTQHFPAPSGVRGTPAGESPPADTRPPAPRSLSFYAEILQMDESGTGGFVTPVASTTSHRTTGSVGSVGSVRRGARDKFGPGNGAHRSHRTVWCVGGGG